MLLIYQSMIIFSPLLSYLWFGWSLYLSMWEMQICKFKYSYNRFYDSLPGKFVALYERL